MDSPKHDGKPIPFVRLPKPLLKRSDLTSTEKVLVALLMSHGRQQSPIYPSLRTLSEQTGITARSVGQALRSLSAKGEFRTVRIGKRCTNRYLPSTKLANLFGYAGLTLDAEGDGKEVPLTEEVSSDHSGRNFPSNSKSNPVIELDNSNRAGAENLSNTDADVLALETDSAKGRGSFFLSQERIGYSHLESVPDGMLSTILRQWKVGPKVASDLAAEFPAWRIRQQLCWLPFRTAEKPAALLVKAIRDEYTCPQGISDADRDATEEAFKGGRVPVPAGAPRLSESPSESNDDLTRSAYDELEEVPF